MTATITNINLSSDNYLEIDINVVTVLRIRLDGDITTTTDGNKIEYTTGSGFRITVNMTPLEWTLQIHSDTMCFNIDYCDFPEMPEVLAEAMTNYMARK